VLQFTTNCTYWSDRKVRFHFVFAGAVVLFLDLLAPLQQNVHFWRPVPRGSTWMDGRTKGRREEGGGIES